MKTNTQHESGGDKLHTQPRRESPTGQKVLSCGGRTEVPFFCCNSTKRKQVHENAPATRSVRRRRNMKGREDPEAISSKQCVNARKNCFHIAAKKLFPEHWAARKNKEMKRGNKRPRFCNKKNKLKKTSAQPGGKFRSSGAKSENTAGRQMEHKPA